MGEFCEPIMPVLLIDRGGTVSFISMGEVCVAINNGFIGELITNIKLLPSSFGPGHLIRSQDAQSRQS